MPLTFNHCAETAPAIFGEIQAPLHSMLQESYDEGKASSLLNNIFSTENSTHAREAYASFDNNAGMYPMAENGEIHSSQMKGGPVQTLENVEWSDSFSISHAALSDDQSGILKQARNYLPSGYWRTREQFGAALIAAAALGKSSMTFREWDFSTLAADGKTLFHTGHVSHMDKKLVQCNAFSDAFSLKAVTRMETAIQNTRNEAGELLYLNPDTILIANDPDLKEEVIELLGSKLDPDSSTNRYNFQCGRWNIAVWPELNRYFKNGEKPWIMLDSKRIQEVPTLVIQDREDLTINSRIERNRTNVLDAFARWTGGFVGWKGVACGGFAGGKQLVTG